MKTQKIIFLIGLMIPSFLSYAQSDRPGREKIEAAKIGLISQRLGLSPEEATRFWPIYNEYSRQREQNHRQFKEARRNFDPQNASEEETRQMLQLGRKTKEKQLKLERDFSDRMLNVINSKQLLSLQEAEREFRDMLLNRLKQRRRESDGGRQEQFRRENNERLRQKRNN